MFNVGGWRARNPVFVAECVAYLKRRAKEKETKNVEDKTNGKVFVELDARELKDIDDCMAFYMGMLKDSFIESHRRSMCTLHQKIQDAHETALSPWGRIWKDEHTSNKKPIAEFHKFYKHEYELILGLVKEEMAKLQKSIDYREKHDLINRACEEFYKQHLVALEAEERAMMGAFNLIRQRINSILDCGDCKEALVYNGK